MEKPQTGCRMFCIIRRSCGTRASSSTSSRRSRGETDSQRDTERHNTTATAPPFAAPRTACACCVCVCVCVLVPSTACSDGCCATRLVRLAPRETEPWFSRLIFLLVASDPMIFGCARSGAVCRSLVSCLAFVARCTRFHDGTTTTRKSRKQKRAARRGALTIPNAQARSRAVR